MQYSETSGSISSVDVVVAGGGPSGSQAARLISEAGLKVLILESKMEVGAPVICGDLVNLSDTGLKDLTDDPRIVISDVDSMNISGKIQIHSSCSGGDAFNLIVERDRLDKELASRAVLAGAKMYLRSELLKVESGATGSTVIFRKGGKVQKVTATHVVVATGFPQSAVQGADMSGHDSVQYHYSRCIGDPIPAPRLDISAGWELRYLVPRRMSEYNDVRIGGASVFAAANDKNGKGRSIISGQASLLANRGISPVDGTTIITGSAAGLYDPFFMTGFREAILSGQAAGEAVRDHFSDPSLTSSAYIERVTGQLLPVFERGRKLADCIRRTDRQKLENFLNDLSEFEYREISTEEIFRVAGLSDSVLEERLPKAH